MKQRLRLSSAATPTAAATAATHASISSYDLQALLTLLRSPSPRSKFHGLLRCTVLLTQGGQLSLSAPSHSSAGLSDDPFFPVAASVVELLGALRPAFLCRLLLSRQVVFSCAGLRFLRCVLHTLLQALRSSSDSSSASLGCSPAAFAGGDEEEETAAAAGAAAATLEAAAVGAAAGPALLQMKKKKKKLARLLDPCVRAVVQLLLRAGRRWSSNSSSRNRDTSSSSSGSSSSGSSRNREYEGERTAATAGVGGVSVSKKREEEQGQQQAAGEATPTVAAATPFDAGSPVAAAAAGRQGDGGDAATEEKREVERRKREDCLQQQQQTAPPAAEQEQDAVMWERTKCSSKNAKEEEEGGGEESEGKEEEELLQSQLADAFYVLLLSLEILGTSVLQRVLLKTAAGAAERSRAHAEAGGGGEGAAAAEEAIDNLLANSDGEAEDCEEDANFHTAFSAALDQVDAELEQLQQQVEQQLEQQQQQQQQQQEKSDTARGGREAFAAGSEAAAVGDGGEKGGAEEGDADEEDVEMEEEGFELHRRWEQQEMGRRSACSSSDEEDPEEEEEELLKASEGRTPPAAHHAGAAAAGGSARRRGDALAAAGQGAAAAGGWVDAAQQLLLQAVRRLLFEELRTAAAAAVVAGLQQPPRHTQKQQQEQEEQQKQKRPEGLQQKKREAGERGSSSFFGASLPLEDAVDAALCVADVLLPTYEKGARLFYLQEILLRPGAGGEKQEQQQQDRRGEKQQRQQPSAGKQQLDLLVLPHVTRWLQQTAEVAAVASLSAAQVRDAYDTYLSAAASSSFLSSWPGGAAAAVRDAAGETRREKAAAAVARRRSWAGLRRFERVARGAAAAIEKFQQQHFLEVVEKEGELLKNLLPWKGRADAFGLARELLLLGGLPLLQQTATGQNFFRVTLRLSAVEIRLYLDDVLNDAPVTSGSSSRTNSSSSRTDTSSSSRTGSTSSSTGSSSNSKGSAGVSSGTTSSSSMTRSSSSSSGEEEGHGSWREVSKGREDRQRLAGAAFCFFETVVSSFSREAFFLERCMHADLLRHLFISIKDAISAALEFVEEVKECPSLGRRCPLALAACARVVGAWVATEPEHFGHRVLRLLPVFLSHLSAAAAAPLLPLLLAYSPAEWFDIAGVVDLLLNLLLLPRLQFDDFSSSSASPAAAASPLLAAHPSSPVEFQEVQSLAASLLSAAMLCPLAELLGAAVEARATFSPPPPPPPCSPSAAATCAPPSPAAAAASQASSSSSRVAPGGGEPGLSQQQETAAPGGPRAGRETDDGSLISWHCALQPAVEKLLPTPQHVHGHATTPAATATVKLLLLPPFPTPEVCNSLQCYSSGSRSQQGGSSSSRSGKHQMAEEGLTTCVFTGILVFLTFVRNITLPCQRSSVSLAAADGTSTAASCSAPSAASSSLSRATGASSSLSAAPAAAPAGAAAALGGGATASESCFSAPAAAGSRPAAAAATEDEKKEQQQQHVRVCGAASLTAGGAAIVGRRLPAGEAVCTWWKRQQQLLPPLAAAAWDVALYMEEQFVPFSSWETKQQQQLWQAVFLQQLRRQRRQQQQEKKKQETQAALQEEQQEERNSTHRERGAGRETEAAAERERKKKLLLQQQMKGASLINEVEEEEYVEELPDVKLIKSRYLWKCELVSAAAALVGTRCSERAVLQLLPAAEVRAVWESLVLQFVVLTPATSAELLQVGQASHALWFRTARLLSALLPQHPLLADVFSEKLTDFEQVTQRSRRNLIPPLPSAAEIARHRSRSSVLDEEDEGADDFADEDAAVVHHLRTYLQSS